MTIGIKGEFLYRKEWELGDDTSIEDIEGEHREFLELWREKNLDGTVNDGCVYSNEIHEHIVTTVEWCLENKDTEEMEEYLEWMNELFAEDEYGKDPYQFTWENMEEFKTFITNNEGFEVW